MELKMNHTHDIPVNNTGTLSLKELNSEAARIYYGADILFAILILPGVIGNLHVLHIYKYKKPNNNSRVFILFLAVADLMTCGMVLPHNIVNCLLPYMYYNDIACKSFTFLNAFVTISSAYALLVIAVERYRKICEPLKKQLKLKYAKYSCLGVAILACVLSSPTFVLFGSTRIPTFQAGSFGYECHYLLEMMDSKFLFIFTGFNLVCSLISCAIMLILYSVIGIRLLKQNKKMGRTETNFHSKEKGLENNDILCTTEGNKCWTNNIMYETRCTSSESDNNVNTQSDCDTLDGTIGSLCNSIDEDGTDKDTRNKNRTSFEIDSGDISKVNIPTKLVPEQKANEKVVNATKSKKTSQAHKTSFIFFLITLVYLISYIPYPILRTYQVRNMDWYNSLDFSDLVAFHTTFGTLYISNVANPFIYIVCDKHFRHEFKTFYLRLFRMECLKK